MVYASFITTLSIYLVLGDPCRFWQCNFWILFDHLLLIVSTRLLNFNRCYISARHLILLKTARICDHKFKEFLLLVVVKLWEDEVVTLKGLQARVNFQWLGILATLRRSLPNGLTMRLIFQEMVWIIIIIIHTRRHSSLLTKHWYLFVFICLLSVVLIVLLKFCFPEIIYFIFKN